MNLIDIEDNLYVGFKDNKINNRTIYVTSTKGLLNIRECDIPYINLCLRLRNKSFEQLIGVFDEQD